MQCDKKGRGIITAIILALMVLTAVPDTMAESGNARITNEKLSPLLTGRIDRIGTDDIVINDTWFKLSDNVSVSGFKKGDLVSFVANSNRELIKIQRAKKRKRSKK